MAKRHFANTNIGYPPKQVKPVVITAKQKKRYWNYLWLVMLLTALLEVVHHTHPYFSFDGVPLFYALYGFIACTIIIAVSKGLGTLLKRRDNYYDQKEESYK